jgi:hypothetical protein
MFTWSLGCLVRWAKRCQRKVALALLSVDSVHQQAYKSTNRVMLISAVPVALGIVLRLLGAKEAPTTSSVNWLVGIGFVLTISLNIIGLFRSRYPVDRVQRGLRRNGALPYLFR